VNGKQLICSVAVWIAGGLSGVVFGQRQPLAEVGLSYWLTLGGVQEELELSESQIDGVADLWVETRERIRAAQRQFADAANAALPPEKRDAVRLQRQAAIESIRREEQKQLGEVLLPHQLQRLRQIRVQYLQRQPAGWESLSEELELTASQIQSIRQLRERLDRESSGVVAEVRLGQRSRADAEQRMAELLTNSREKLRQVLTQDQQDQLRELSGEAFSFQARDPRSGQTPAASEPEEGPAASPTGNQHGGG
jgi:hypothetical protein